jgi:heat-inducible transcriptional repressor
MVPQELSDRERRVLEAVIQSYVETAEPAGSRTLSRRFGLGVSAATIRNTMSDLEEKGYLFHPHTSAGRVPTDKAYRTYVDGLMRVRPLASAAQAKIAEELRSGGTIELILQRAAQTLGVLTQELGVALGPSLEQTVLQRLDLVRVSSDKLVLVMTLRGGAVRTVFVEVRGEIAETALAEVTHVLNERLAGLTIAQIKGSLALRLRDAVRSNEAGNVLNIFLEEGEQLFEAAIAQGAGEVVLSPASMLAEQPEFARLDEMRRLMELTETRQRLAAVLRERAVTPGITITIGAEHGDPLLGKLTVVTAEYRAGDLSGVIGVIGPTRMPYEKVVSVVTHTSRLVTALLE